jgi:hypothetical protein
MPRLTAGMALRHALLRQWGHLGGWHKHGQRLISQRHGLRAQRGIDGVEDLRMRENHLVQRFAEILEQMKAVRNLDGGRGALACTLSVGLGAVACDHLHSRMLPEPLRQGLGRALRQQGHRLPEFQVHQDGAIRVAFPQGEIVHTEDLGCGKRRGRLPAQPPQQGVAAHGQVPHVAEVHPSRPPEGDAPRATRR